MIDMALREIRGIAPDAEMSLSQLDRGARALNAILREDDAHGTGQNKNLWALDEAVLFLQVGGYIYNVVDDGLRGDILDIVSASFRNKEGEDTLIRIVPTEAYDSVKIKDDTGDVKLIYLKRNIVLASQVMYVNPVPSSLGTTSTVLGTDSKNYKCVVSHTSAAINKPITGTSYKLYWSQQGAVGGVWATATAYTNAELITYTYKRPLFDFDTFSDNPDMPQGWIRYLKLRLAHDLAPAHGIALDERLWLEKQWRTAREEIFPSTRPISNDFHKKAMYF